MRRFSHILKRKNIILFVSFAEKMCFTLVMLAFAPYHFIYIFFFKKLYKQMALISIWTFCYSRSFRWCSSILKEENEPCPLFFLSLFLLTQDEIGER